MVSRQKGALVSARTALQQKDALVYAKAALALSQRPGLFQSNRIWRELWKAEPQLQMYYVALQTVIVSPFYLLCFVYVRPFWLSLLVIALCTFLGGGVAEMVLRLWVLRRARLTAARSHDDEATIAPAEPRAASLSPPMRAPRRRLRLGRGEHPPHPRARRSENAGGPRRRARNGDGS